MKNFQLTILFFSLIITIISCKKDLSTANINEDVYNVTPSPPINSSNGILIFSSSYSLDSVLKKLDTFSDSIRYLWEVNYGFNSMDKIYKDICIGELALADSLANANDSSEINGTIHHCNLANQYTRILIERQFPANEGGGGYFEKNIFFDRLSWITDYRGLVIIGDTLFNFSKDTLKYLVNGGIGDINYLMSSNSTDSVNGVYVVPSNGYVFLRKSSSYQNFQRQCRNTNGRTRVLTYQDFIQGAWLVSSHTRTTYIVTTKGLKRRLFGAWWDSKPMALEISWEISGNSCHEGAYTFSSPPMNPSQNLAMSSNGVVQESNSRQIQLFLPYGTKSPTTHITNDIANFNFGSPTISSANVTGKVCDGGQCAQCTTTY